MTLGLKLSRRLATAVAVDGEDVVFHDSRYIARRREQVESRLREYFDRLFEQLKPAAVYVYAPTAPETLTSRAIRLLQEAADRHAILYFEIDRTEMRAAVALQPDAKRQQVYERSASIWPEVTTLRKPQQVAFAEAAVTA